MYMHFFICLHLFVSLFILTRARRQCCAARRQRDVDILWHAFGRRNVHIRRRRDFETPRRRMRSHLRTHLRTSVCALSSFDVNCDRHEQMGMRVGQTDEAAALETLHCDLGFWRLIIGRWGRNVLFGCER